MCGILAILASPDAQLRATALALSKKLRHRGPDWSGLIVAPSRTTPTTYSYLCHERLAIVGLGSGAQPLVDGALTLCVNGEIYNHRELRASLRGTHTFKTESDCEVLLYLYREHGPRFAHLLDGIFSFVLHDAENNRFVVARDPIGVTSLYWGRTAQDQSVWVSSELKALNAHCAQIDAFPPGHFYDSRTDKTERYYAPDWLMHPERLPPADDNSPPPLAAIRTGLEAAVAKRLMTEVPYGVLLSGGLDSSLIAAIASRLTRRAKPTDNTPAAQTAALWPRLHSFSIGLPGAPDLAAARRVAAHLGTAHHEFTFTVQEGLDAVSDVIYHLETYDVTTVRASVPMYLLARRIRAMGIKMVLSGEGADEVFGGYLYFHAAPTDAAFHAECVARVHNLSTADCLRANKSTMAWGLEARVPFLDRGFLDVAMNVHPRHKRASPGRIEKHLLRAAFDDPKDPYLPRDVLWRQKEQFSDGVGYDWITQLRAHAEAHVADRPWEQRHVRFPKDTPATREAYYYRDLFHTHFPQPACAESVQLWVPRLDWGCAADPSGRAQRVHVAHMDGSNKKRAYESEEQQGAQKDASGTHKKTKSSDADPASPKKSASPAASPKKIGSPASPTKAANGHVH